MLPSPRSASSTSTRLPACAKAIAVFATTLVLPTPPFPLVTVITWVRGEAGDPSPPLICVSRMPCCIS